MVKPVAGEIVVIPFPRNDTGKRRPAFVIADLPGADLILCQITSRAHFDGLRSRWIIAIVSAGKSISRATFARNGFSRSNITSFFTHSEKSPNRNSMKS
jgi:hypothetical protein